MNGLNSIWEWIVPAAIIAVVCARCAYKRDKNVLLWLVLGFLFSFLALMYIGSPMPQQDRAASKPQPVEG